MTDEIGICIQANKLSKGAVRRFFEALNSGTAGTVYGGAGTVGSGVTEFALGWSILKPAVMAQVSKFLRVSQEV